MSRDSDEKLQKLKYEKQHIDKEISRLQKRRAEIITSIKVLSFDNKNKHKSPNGLSNGEMYGMIEGAHPKVSPPEDAENEVEFIFHDQNHDQHHKSYCMIQ